MKKISLFLMSIALILVLCSCGQKNTFVEGNLLYDLGAESFEDIQKVGFWYEAYQGDCEEKIEITQKDDIEILFDYMYSSDYPENKLHELFLFPTNSIYVTISDVEYQLYLGKEGALTVVPRTNLSIGMRTYNAQEGKGFNSEVWKELIQKYT